MSVCGWVLLKDSSLAPDSAGLPNSVSLPLTACSALGWLRGMGQRGRGQTADTGEPGAAFTPGRYCTRENVSTKDHMAPFCIEPSDKGWKGGGEAARRHTSRGHQPRPPQTAGWQLGENGGTFPIPPPHWLGSCDVPAFPPAKPRAQGGFLSPCPTREHASGPGHRPSRQKR